MFIKCEIRMFVGTFFVKETSAGCFFRVMEILLSKPVQINKLCIVQKMFVIEFKKILKIS